MVERVLCKHEVVGSIPSDSTILCQAEAASDRGTYEFPPRPKASARAGGGNLTS